MAGDLVLPHIDKVDVTHTQVCMPKEISDLSLSSLPLSAPPSVLIGVSASRKQHQLTVLLPGQSRLSASMTASSKSVRSARGYDDLSAEPTPTNEPRLYNTY